MFTVDEILENHFPKLNRNTLLVPSIKSVLRKLLHENDFISFNQHYPHLQGMDFVEQVLEYFHFSYTVSDRDRENIPPLGRVVIIANHPIGTLDGLALLKLIHEVRSDIRIVANDMLMLFKPLRSYLLPVNNMHVGHRSTREQLTHIGTTLQNEGAVIIFPCGEVSRLRPGGIKDGRWQKGFLSIAGRAGAPILPIHISGQNSRSFYTASMFWRPLSTALLIDEMFKQQKNQIQFTVGKIIPHQAYQDLPIRNKDKVKLFRKHIYRIGKGRQPVFRTESAIARPERRSDLKKALDAAQLLGRTPDGKQIFLHAARGSSPILREIGRLREVTFRAVDEGTGRRRDMDRFDNAYQHLILWDDKDLEIVGAYRFVDSGAVLTKQGLTGLYTNSLFAFDAGHQWFLEQGLEMGRSFIQQRYWGKRSLDYLWYGIGAFLAGNPGYRYLFGPVSLSNGMPQAAKELLVYFYKIHFGAGRDLACSKNPFNFSRPPTELAQEFSGTNYNEDFKKLKTLLGNMGTSVPTLYKQYSELCEPGGVHFLDFNVDPEFSNCVDGLVVVDLEKLKKKKRRRYIDDSILERP